jgi:hypothetical protein
MNMPLVLLNRRRRGGFSPLMLFAISEPGVWYDPSDLTTMFTDTTGTTPATVGSAVALLLDKSGNGINATQATLAARPILGRVPSVGRRNLLVRTEEFDNAAWTKTFSGAGSAPVVTANAGTDPLGGTTAERVVFTLPSGAAIGDISLLTQAFTYTAGNHIFSVWVRSNTGQNQTFILTNENIQSSVLTATTAWQRFSFVRNATGGASSCGIRIRGTQTGDSADLLIWGAQLELGSTATAYQRVGSTFDVTEAGQPDNYYLSFDGVDDSMVTPTITPGVVQVQVFAGVRKLSDDARGTIVEHSATIDSNNGAFHLTAPNAASATFGFESKGTTLTDAVASATAPITSVLTGLGDIAGDTATIRVNGAQQDQDTGDQGTGNYLAYPLYIGRRGGTTLPLDGQIFSLIVRFGANLTNDQIVTTEKWVSGKTAGVSL